MDVLSQIRDSLDEAEDIWKSWPAYYLFEGWDVAERTPEAVEQAISDGVDLQSDELMRSVGMAPHGFQNGFILSTKFQRGLTAAGQVGKSSIVFMEILMSASGEIPFAYRYKKGHDTGIPRLITQENIWRWGRRAKASGVVIDRDIHAKQDGTWDCGNVTGCGIFPQEKIVPHGSIIRLGSYQCLIMQNWWSVFNGSKKDQMGAFLPPHFIDKSRGSFQARGSNKQDKQVYLPRGVTLQMLTYEAGKEGFEGILVPTYLDEEPPNYGIIAAVTTHAAHWSIAETPYLGITQISKGILFPEKRTIHSETFHAAATDCPYKTPKIIAQQREPILKTPWELGSRFWGIPSEAQGEPYYDRQKINFWIQRYKMQFDWVRFEATEPWHGIVTNHEVSHLPGLMDVEVIMVPANKDDLKATWRLYEQRKDLTAYINASDQADGAEIASEAGDASTCTMGRQDEEDPTMPVIAATLRSTLPTAQFTVETLLACRYFHNALVIPESGRGAANEAFKLTAQDWPYWFRDSVKSQKTRKSKEQLGFCPTTDRRETIYNVLIKNWIDSFEEDEYPKIPDEWILREASMAVVGKTTGGAARCDHPSNGTIDSLNAFGILLYGMQHGFNRQIKYHGPAKKERKLTWLDRALLGKVKQQASDTRFLGDLQGMLTR